MWNDLTMSERADVIKMAVKAGLRDMKSIRKFYDDSLKYADGGPKVTSKNRGNLFSGKDTPTQQMTTKSKQAPWYSELDEAVMGELMQEFRNIAHPGNIEHASYKTDVRGKKGGTAQRTYLLPRFEQEDIFLRDGYIKGKEGDYGLVKKAVNNRNLPVWQTKPDAVNRETLVPIGNAYGMDSYGYINRDKDLVHAESHPAAFYVDGSTGKLYTKGWDLNDYGGIGGGNSSKYNILEKVGANILDFIGSPVVVTTGFQEVTNPWGGPSEHLNRGATIQDLFDYDDDGHPIKSNLGKLLDTTMNKQGLHRENIDGKWVYSLPEVTVDGNKKAEGGSIYIAPSKRGTFTAAATKHNMGVQEFASKVLANKDNYSPAMVKKANFAKNASKWKHCLGGYLFEEGGPKVTLVDSDKVRMNDSSVFSDENGNIIGDSVVLPNITIRAHKGYKSTYDKDTVNAGKITKGIVDLAAYTKSYLNSKFRPSEGEIIDLSDKEVARIKSNTNDVSSILINDFVESKNSNLIRKKEDFINTEDTLLGDRNIPLSKISTFYGIENGKLKAGPLSIFDDTTTVVPNRAKYIGKIREYHPNTSKESKDEYLDSLDAAVRRYNIEHNYKPKGLEKILLPIIEDQPQYTLYQNVGDGSHAIIHKLAEPYKHLLNKSNNSYAITESGDTIRPYNINATPKTLFADEDGNAIFTSLSESNLDELNKHLNKTPMYPIMVDNGRYAFYQTESPNVGVYSGLNNPNEMFILGTVAKRKRRKKVK